MKLLDILANMTQKDLDDLYAEETALEKRLKMIRQAISITEKAVGAEPSRANNLPKTGPGKGTVTKNNRETVAKYLLHAGTTRRAVLIAATKVPSGSSTAILDHEWFTISGDMVSLSDTGKMAFDH